MATTLEIIQGLAQAAAHGYDGAHDERYSHDGQARKVGLQREEGDPILDRRVIDGFKVPSVRKASELLYKKYYIMKMAINFIFDLLETQVNKIINKKLKQLEENDEMLKVQESMLEKLKT